MLRLPDVQYTWGAANVHVSAGHGMAAEVADDLSKAQKRELKWERKQAKVKAAAEASGQTYVPPSKEEKEAASDKVGKRKKRKLAALQQGSAVPASPATDPSTSKKKNKKEAVVHSVTNGVALPQPEPAVTDQSKAEKKAAKKAKKAASTDTDASPSIPPAATTDPAKPAKKKKKLAREDSATITTETDDQSTAAEIPPKKKSKKQKTGSSDTPMGRITVRQEAVLASVGDKELAKTGKTIQKNLYHEHAAVAAMTMEEVTKHRADRDTAVTGADLRPVLQFDQAGDLWRLVCFFAVCTAPVRP